MIVMAQARHAIGKRETEDRAADNKPCYLHPQPPSANEDLTEDLSELNNSDLW